jgi:hypothetical protein
MPARAVHEADCDIAASIFPKNITFAVAIEIDSPNDRPAGGRGPDGRRGGLHVVVAESNCTSPEPSLHTKSASPVAIEVALSDA